MTTPSTPGPVIFAPPVPAPASIPPPPPPVVEQQHASREFLSIQAAASFGVQYEVLVGAFHLAGVQPDDLLRRADVAAHVKTFLDRPIP